LLTFPIHVDETGMATISTTSSGCLISQSPPAVHPTGLCTSATGDPNADAMFFRRSTPSKMPMRAPACRIWGGQRISGIDFDYDDGQPEDYNSLIPLVEKYRQKLIADGVL